jgi:excisionase family DNA binding protein
MARKSRAPVERQAYTVAEFAHALGLSRAFAYKLIDEGEVRTVRLGRRVLVPRTEVDRILADGISAAAE